jgi:glycosyltransferase involved in cell wall biosynthesis
VTPRPLDLLVLNWLDRENPQAGGAEVHLHEVFGRLVERGHRVTLICSGFEGAASRTVLDGIEVHRTGGRHTLSLAAPRYYRKHFSDRRFSAVIEDLNKVPFFSPWWAREPVALIVHHLFGRVAFQEASFPVALATWLLEKPIGSVFRGHPCIAVSESTAQDLVARGLRRSDITVIPNGIDSRTYRPTPEVESFAEPTVLYLGRLRRYKRVDLIIQAIAALQKRGLNVRLRIGGKGAERPQLERLVRSLRLEGLVTFEGFVDEERKLDLLRRSWVHILTSPKEGWGIANLEAAGCGTPTIASDSPGLRDSVLDHRTGLLVEHGNVEALADSIETLVTDSRLLRRLGSGALEFSHSFAWDRLAQDVEKFLVTRVAEAQRAD